MFTEVMIFYFHLKLIDIKKFLEFEQIKEIIIQKFLGKLIFMKKILK
jgi:hypothetical protein